MFKIVTAFAIVCAGIIAAGNALQSPLDKHVARVEATVRSMMKDPSSARIDRVRAFERDGDKYVCGYVSGRNSFGAMSEAVRFISVNEQVRILQEGYMMLHTVIGEKRSATPMAVCFGD